MKTRTYRYLCFALLIFLGLVYFNYYEAQSAIRETQASPLSVNLVSYPESVKEGSLGSFIWSLEASSDLSTDHTTIFWGYVSSASALPKTASPEAVGYPNSQPDYSTGYFRLPGTFDLRIPFTQLGRVYFRAYAKVRGNHLWSREEHLDIVK